MESDYMPGVLVEFVMVGFSLTLVAVYHRRLWGRQRDEPESTVMGRHALARAAWARSAEGAGLPIVQAMRNAIMAATFLASTAVLLAAGLLGAVFTRVELPRFLFALNFLGVESQGVWMFKALLLTTNFLAAFVNFSLAMRSFVHIGLMATTDSATPEKDVRHSIADEMERAALHYLLGTRGLYLAIPLAFWFFGPVWMLLGSVVLVAVLSRVD